MVTVNGCNINVLNRKVFSNIDESLKLVIKYILKVDGNEKRGGSGRS